MTESMALRLSKYSKKEKAKVRSLLEATRKRQSRDRETHSTSSKPLSRHCSDASPSKNTSPSPVPGEFHIELQSPPLKAASSSAPREEEKEVELVTFSLKGLHLPTVTFSLPFLTDRKTLDVSGSKRATETVWEGGEEEGVGRGEERRPIEVEAEVRRSERKEGSVEDGREVGREYIITGSWFDCRGVLEDM